MKNWILIAITFMMFSCRNEHSDTDIIKIDLTGAHKVKDFSYIHNYISDVQIIPLETSENSFIRYINSLTVTDDRIIVFDQYDMQHQIKVFDKKGKWIVSSSQGQGPGEIVKAYDMAYDFVNEKIVIKQNRRLTHFDKDMKYIDDKNCPAFVCFKIQNGGYVFKTIENQNGEEFEEEYNHHRIFVADDSFNIINSAYPTIADNTILSPQEMVESKDGICVVNSHCDTIYLVKNSQIVPKYVLDYPSKIEKAKMELNDREFSDYIDTHSGYSFCCTYNESDTHQFMRIDNYADGLFIYAFREKDSGNMIKMEIDREYLGKIGRVFAFPETSYGDRFIYVLSPEEIGTNINILRPFVSDEDYNLLKNMDEEANPVLVLYSFKSFE